MDNDAVEAQVASVRWDGTSTAAEQVIPVDGTGVPVPDLAYTFGKGAPSDPHPSRIIPTEFKVLIKPDDVGDKFEGSSILRPDTVKERDQYAAMKGTLVAVSPLAFTYENWPEGERKPQVGDRVIFAKYAGATVKGADDVEYRLVNDKDVAAILV